MSESSSPQSSRDELGTVAGGAALTAVGGVVSGLSGFLTLALVARELGAAAAGVLGVSIAVSVIITQVDKLGADTAFVHFLPRLHIYAGGSANLRRLLVVWLSAVAAFGLISGCLLWAVATPLANVLLGGVPVDLAATALKVVALGLPPAALTAVALAAVRGLGSIRPLVVNDQIAKPVVRLVLIGVVVALGGGVQLVVLAWSAPQWVLLPWALMSLRRRVADTKRTSKDLDSALARGFARYAGLRSVSASVEILGMYVGLLLVGAALGAEDAGVYSVATRLVLAGYLTLQAFRLAVATQMSAALAEPTPAHAEVLHQLTSAWIVLSAWPVYIVLCVLSPQVLAFFGPEFTSGWPVLTLVALGGLVSVGAGNIQTVLLMSGRAGEYLGVAIASVCANVLTTLVLAPRIGVEGAAIGVLVAAVTENASVLVLCRVRQGIHHFGRPVLTAYAVSLATVGVGCGLVRVLDLNGAGLLAVAIGSGVIYLAACWTLRETLALDELVSTARGLKRRREPSAQAY